MPFTHFSHPANEWGDEPSEMKMEQSLEQSLKGYKLFTETPISLTTFDRHLQQRAQDILKEAASEGSWHNRGRLQEIRLVPVDKVDPKSYTLGFYLVYVKEANGEVRW